MRFICWTRLCCCLRLSLGGNNILLIIVPAIAGVLEIVDKWLGWAPRLPYSMAEMIIAIIFFVLAKGLYGFGCPELLRGCGSTFEWQKKAADVRAQLIARIDNDTILKDKLVRATEARVEEVLRGASGSSAFRPEEIEIIKSHIVGAFKKKTDFTGESIKTAQDTFQPTYEKLNIEKPYTRLVCGTFVATAFTLMGIVILGRIISVIRSTY